MIEMGDRTYQLGPGDAVLAPRAVLHVWAFVGSERGRILITFQPGDKWKVFLWNQAN